LGRLEKLYSITEPSSLTAQVEETIAEIQTITGSLEGDV